MRLSAQEQHKNLEETTDRYNNLVPANFDFDPSSLSKAKRSASADRLGGESIMIKNWKQWSNLQPEDAYNCTYNPNYHL